jgi:CheY-like chemotaxis protein
MGCSEERSVAKILVADDNSNIQKMVGLALKDQGIDVVAVGNGEAAVRKISDLKPDLVLADVFMPVRNGYEVCNYVKQDPALAHIPVILLVGAFDPLDEQEAQRVGADGVLKKPFVPPDPLISMVKSALARAGVALGNAPAVEKVAEASKRNAADLLSPAASKLAAFSAAPPPMAEPEQIPEEFPTLPPQLKIAAGEEPVAFGSLLETPEAEEDAAFIPAKPPTELSAGQNWGADEVEEEEDVEEEEASGNGWRPGGDLTAVEADEAEIENKVKDWREEAFHGSSPARAHRSQRWSPAVSETAVAETTESRAVAVTTLEPVQAETPAFSGDAWAAALAAGIEDKLAETRGAASAAPEAEKISNVAPVLNTQETVTEQTHSQQAAPESAPENNWYSATASPWEVEAKKATQLASTWDSAAVEQPAVVNEHPPADIAKEQVEEAAIENAEPVQEFVHGVQPEEAPALVHEVTFESTNNEATPPAYAAELNVNDTQEIESYQPTETNSFDSTWVAAPPEVVNQFVEASAQEFVNEKTEPPVVEQAREQAAHQEAAAAAPSTNMDELVARVLSRMSPDVLQRVTHDILKPVIEALIQDELNAKKQ